MNNFKIEEKGALVHLKIARGKKYNALDAALLEEFAQAVNKVKDLPGKIVVLSGEGDGFCAGGDLAMMEQIEDGETYDQVMNSIEEIVTSLYTMPKIVISALHGPVIGLGLSIALAADYVIAEEKTKISMNFIGIGLAPDGGGHFWLKQRLGTHQAKHFAWEGKQMNAQEAYDLKLVDFVVKKQVLKKAEEIAERWAERPLIAMIATKDIYHKHSLDQLMQYLSNERLTQWQLRQTHDHKEGVQAFMENRNPNFKGR